MLSSLKSGALILAIVFTHSMVQQAHSAEPSKQDCYITGYATALLEKVYDFPETRVEVFEGQVRLLNPPKDKNKRKEIIDAIKRINGVVNVVIKKEHKKSGPFDLPSTFKDEVDTSTEGFFPKDDLFQPLFANPWESRFYASWRHDEYLDTNMGAVGLGEVFGFYRWTDVFGPGHDLQLNIEAAAFAYFDLDADSNDLHNIDFQVGFPFVYKYKDFATRFRLMHHSSHLGDEFLEKNKQILDELEKHQTNNNFIDLTFSYNPGLWRVYGGGTYIFDHTPSRDPWEIDYGFEFRPWHELSIHPIAGIHIKQMGELSWKFNQRYVMGIEISDWPARNRITQVLAEYYKGNNLGWPFYKQDGEYYGAGIYLDF